MLLRGALRALSVAAPRLAGRWLYHLWLATHRFPEPSRETRWRQQASTFTVASNGGPLTFYSWGQGPGVLLLHGWNGRGTQMGAFAAPLVQAGYRAVALDAPGHGRSPGNSATIFQIIDAVERAADAVGPLAGVVTHSFGAMVIARALRDGLTVQRVVCIAPPARMAFLIDSFCTTLRAPPAARADLMRRLQLRFGADIEAQVAADANAAQLSVPALIIHDRDDRDVPWQQGELLAKAWPGARLVLTRGLGHSRILRNGAVIQASVDFIAGARAEQRPRRTIGGMARPPGRASQLYDFGCGCRVAPVSIASPKRRCINPCPAAQRGLAPSSHPGRRCAAG